MSVDAHFGERLREERERCSLTQKQVADAIGVRREMWVRYEGGVEPGAGVIARAAEAGLDVLYVLTGERRPPALKYADQVADLDASGRVSTGAQPSRQFLREAAAGHKGGLTNHAKNADGLPQSIDLVMWHQSASSPLVLPVTFVECKTTREYEVIPRLKAEASAGPGRGNAEEATLEAAGVMALDRQWMFDNFGRKGEGFATVQVHGDSMEPTLFNGETIVIDTKVSRIDVSGIYVIKAGADVLVKRIQRKFDGTLVLKSDNAAYEPETLSPVEAGAVEVQGRMVWPRVR